MVCVLSVCVCVYVDRTWSFLFSQDTLEVWGVREDGKVVSCPLSIPLYLRLHSNEMKDERCIPADFAYRTE